MLATIALACLMLAGTALARVADPGNGIAISVSAGARAGQVYNGQISGSSRGRALAVLSIDYGGCARS